MRHAWYMIPQCRSLDSRCLKCWLWLARHRVIWGSIVNRNTKQTAVVKLTMIKHLLQMYGWLRSSMFALDLSSLIRFWKRNRTGDQPHQKPVELHTMPSFDPYSKQWPTLWLVCSLTSIRPKLNFPYFVTAITSSLHPRSGSIPSGKCC